MNRMSIMGQQGDTRISWDPQNPEQVKEAQRVYDDLKKLGYLAFSLSEDGQKGEQVAAFDPAIRWLIMAPAMRGGR